jgi:cobalt-zinc-cadmium efflux system outer membrane protein
VSAERQAEWAVGPLVELELPLFYQNQGEAQAAVSEMRRQKSLFDALALRVRAGARATAARLSAIRRNAAHYRDTVLPLRARILEASQLEYNAMNIGVFQLLEAKRAQVQAGSASVETLRDYWLSRADAEQLLAGRLPSSAFGMEAPVGEGSTVQPRPAGATH